MIRTVYILFSALCLMACKNSIQSNTTTHNILWISGITVNCDNNALKHCLQIQDSETPNIEKWMPWKDSIVDFNPEFGYMYKIKVKTKPLKKNERLTHNELVEYQLLDILEKKQDPTIVLYDIWGLYSMNEEILNTSSQRPRLEINLSKHNVMGNAFCNQISGSVYALDNKVKFSKLASTKRACMNLEHEIKFLNLLEQDLTFKQEKNLMKFYDSDGKEVLAFKKLD